MVCPLLQYDGHRGRLLAADGNSIDCMFVDRRGSPDVNAKGNKLVGEAVMWMIPASPLLTYMYQECVVGYQSIYMCVCQHYTLEPGIVNDH